MNRFQITILIVGGAIFSYGVVEWQLKTIAKEQPRTVSASELAANGPGSNAHIILTDFSLCGDFVYVTRRDRWRKVLVPAIPTGRAFDRANVRIIVIDSSCRNERDVEAMDTGRLQGLVTNRISSLTTKEKKLLQESYPGSNIANCWIVERNRKLLAAEQVIFLMGGGGLTTLFGVALIVQAVRS